MADDSTPEGTTAGATSELTFSGFVIGLAQQALMSLGLAPAPEAENAKKDLAHAKAVIDILTMLRDKTRGNLDEVETRLMDEMLDELKLQYVRETRDSRKAHGGGS